MKFPVLYADPPWPFEVWSKATGQGRSAETYYDTMTWARLARLGGLVKQVAAPDCVLFLWVCPPLLEQTLRVVKSLGFSYRTKAFCWVKLNAQNAAPSVNLGYFTRSNSEDVWLCTRGHPERQDKGVAQVLETLMARPNETPTIRSRPGPHSEKPEEIAHRIQQLFAGPYCELFARRRRPGWTSIGNELDGLDIRRSLAHIISDRPLPVLHSLETPSATRVRPTKRTRDALTSLGVTARLFGDD